ncbi:MAG: hemolysin family protein [Treponema sp.]|nr:hemolysin family protein [Treponema sp.]
MIKVILTLVLILLLIVCVAFFSGSETAYLSLPKLKLRRMQEDGVRHVKFVTKLKNNMDQLLTTVLIGTNFINSLISALATALVVSLFGGEAVGFSTFVVAFFLTIFGQIIPKTLAGLYPEKFSAFSSVILYALEKIFFPIVWLFSKLASAISFIIEKIMKNSPSGVTEEELKTMLEVGANEGTIAKNEHKMLNKIIAFNDLDLMDIMKHRSFVSMVSDEASQEDVVEEFLRSGFSTLTVYKGRKDNVVGVLNYKNVLYNSNNDNSGPGYAGRMMKKDVLFVPGTFSVLDLLKKFRSDEHKFAVVLTEQGETAGIVTMEDIIRVVFGRMTDENATQTLPAEERIKLVSLNNFLVPGDVKLEELNEILGLNLESEDMNTIGGWLLEQLGYLPSSGTVYVKDKILFTAEDVAQRRIITVRIMK